MQDYSRNPVPGFTGSRYGTIHDLDAATEEFTLKNDRSFTFAIDKLDNDETAQQLAAASALARQVREKVVPEVDSYTYGVMCSSAGHKPAAVILDATNIFDEILKAGDRPHFGSYAGCIHHNEAEQRYHYGNGYSGGYAP